MEENKEVKQKNNKLGVFIVLAVGLVMCVGAFFLGQSLANKEDEILNKEETKEDKQEETNKEENKEEQKEDTIEPYSYKSVCQNIDESYLVDVDVNKYNNIVDYIDEQENVEIVISYCTVNSNDVNGDEPFIGDEYILNDSEEKKVLDDIRKSKYTLTGDGLGGACVDSLEIHYEHNGKKYDVSFYSFMALSSNDGNIYAILDKGKNKKEYCEYQFENLSPTANSILNALESEN